MTASIFYRLKTEWQGNPLRQQRVHNYKNEWKSRLGRRSNYEKRHTCFGNWSFYKDGRAYLTVSLGSVVDGNEWIVRKGGCYAVWVAANKVTSSPKSPNLHNGWLCIGYWSECADFILYINVNLSMTLRAFQIGLMMLLAIPFLGDFFTISSYFCMHSFRKVPAWNLQSQFKTRSLP